MKVLLVTVLMLMLSTGLWADLQSHYQKGRIILKAVEDFGQGNDWESLFFDPYKDMVVAPDGSIFIANINKDNIYQFDPQGKLLKTFGRRGNGPGDFIGPGDLSILDGKSLVVSEYASNRRFSLWDLNGNYKQIVRTQNSVFYLTALRNNHAAFYYINQGAEKKNGYQSVISIILKNITTGNETLVKKITLFDRSHIILGNFASVCLGNFFSEVFLVQTIEGNLALGISNQPHIEIFSPAGEKIRTFDLKIEPVVVDDKYIMEFRGQVMADLKKRGERPMNRTERFWYEMDKKTFKHFDFSTIFAKHLPLYKEIMVDAEGNFLVFKYNECQKDCTPVFQVYSNEGKFICETQLDGGIYDLEIDRRFKKLYFAKEGIYAIVQEKGDEDEILRLIKSYYSPAS